MYLECVVQRRRSAPARAFRILYFRRAAGNNTTPVLQKGFLYRGRLFSVFHSRFGLAAGLDRHADLIPTPLCLGLPFHSQRSKL